MAHDSGFLTVPGVAVHHPWREVGHGLEGAGSAAAGGARGAVMQIADIVLGLAVGVGIDLSPDGKTAYYVEWSVGELNRVDVDSGSVTTVLTGPAHRSRAAALWGRRRPPS